MPEMTVMCYKGVNKDASSCFPGEVSQENLKSVKTSEKMGVFRESKACTSSKHLT